MRPCSCPNSVTSLVRSLLVLLRRRYTFLTCHAEVLKIDLNFLWGRNCSVSVAIWKFCFIYPKAVCHCLTQPGAFKDLFSYEDFKTVSLFLLYCSRSLLYDHCSTALLALSVICTRIDKLEIVDTKRVSYLLPTLNIWRLIWELILRVLY